MHRTDASLEPELPELSYGSAWLIGAGDGDPSNLSQLAVRALSAADAVIHDPGIPQQILDFVRPLRYCEAVAADQAVERAVKLAQDGWRAVYLVKGSDAGRAGEYSARLAEHGILPRILSHASEPVGGETQIKLLLVWQPVPVGTTQAGTAVTLIAAARPSQSAGNAQREAPPDFSMSGLAG